MNTISATYSDEQLARIPSEMLFHGWRQDPQTMVLVLFSEIKEGDVVLADPVSGFAFSKEEWEDSTKEKHHMTVARALETDRWCMVTKLNISGVAGSFIGVYADGTQYKRTYHHSWAFYVLL